MSVIRDQHSARGTYYAQEGRFCATFDGFGKDESSEHHFVFSYIVRAYGAYWGARQDPRFIRLAQTSMLDKVAITVVWLPYPWRSRATPFVYLPLFEVMALRGNRADTAWYVLGKLCELVVACWPVPKCYALVTRDHNPIHSVLVGLLVGSTGRAGLIVRSPDARA